MINYDNRILESQYISQNRINDSSRREDKDQGKYVGRHIYNFDIYSQNVEI